MSNLSTPRNVFTVLRWTVRILSKGDKYGLNNCLTHDEDEKVVEFYDNHQDKSRFSEFGQFVARYDLDTIINHTNCGLQLDGGIPEWRVAADELQLIRKHLIKLTES
jgi:hypothetical protein